MGLLSTFPDPPRNPGKRPFPGNLVHLRGNSRFPGVRTPESRESGVRTPESRESGVRTTFSGFRGSGPLFWGPGGRIREVRPLRKLVLRLVWEISGSCSTDILYTQTPEKFPLNSCESLRYFLLDSYL